MLVQVVSFSCCLWHLPIITFYLHDFPVQFLLFYYGCWKWANPYAECSYHAGKQHIADGHDEATVDEANKNMEEDHGKEKILNKHTFGLFEFDDIWDNDEGAQGEAEIATGYFLRGPELSSVEMGEMKSQWHRYDAVDDNYCYFVGQLYSEYQPQMLLVVYFLLAVEFPYQSYFIHYSLFI